jgi:hypothetical protein
VEWAKPVDRLAQLKSVMFRANNNPGLMPLLGNCPMGMDSLLPSPYPHPGLWSLDAHQLIEFAATAVHHGSQYQQQFFPYNK